MFWSIENFLYKLTLYPTIGYRVQGNMAKYSCFMNQEEDEILKELSDEDLMNNLGDAPIVSKERKDGTKT